MKNWRAVGLVWAVFALGNVGGCDSGGGKTDKDDASEEEVREDGGTLDSGRDARPPVEEADADAPDAEEADTGPSVETDAEADASMSCQPMGCRELGYSCGAPEDGCGGPLACGECTGTNTCGGGGKQFVCGCTPTTCEKLTADRGVKACGMMASGCGAMIDCGGSEVCGGGFQTCGGAGNINECGCAPNPNACAGKECGTAADGCGGTLQCGASAGQCSAVRECSPQQTCTCRTDNTAFCAGKCGPQTEDGCAINCGPCTQGTCASGGACTDCECPDGANPGADDDEICRAGTCCIPQPLAQVCGTAQCGTKVNNCGQTVSCGTACAGETPFCVQERCVSSQVNALVGTYAVRQVGFAYIESFGSRTEGYTLVNIRLNESGQLVYREQSCATLTRANIGGESDAAFFDPKDAVKIAPVEIVLQVPGPNTLPGAREWFRDKAAAPRDTLGWRRGRPTYCPAPTAQNPQPDPDPAHPDFAPAPDPAKFGAGKPWLSAPCLCPEKEFALHAPCQRAKPEDRAACLADPATLSLPWQPGRASPDSAVTDCRVNDEDQDGFPAVTIAGKLITGGVATTRSTAGLASQSWGDIDESGAKLHKGVAQDLPETTSAIVGCVAVSGLGGSALCSASTADFCPGYVDDLRSNPVDFVPLSTPLTCKQIWDGRAGLFPLDRFPNLSNKYPPLEECRAPASN